MIKMIKTVVFFIVFIKIHYLSCTTYSDRLYEPSLDDPISDLTNFHTSYKNGEMLRDSVLSDPIYQFQEEEAMKRNRFNIGPQGMYMNYDDGLRSYPHYKNSVEDSNDTGTQEDDSEDDEDDDNDDYDDDEDDNNANDNEERKARVKQLRRLARISRIRKLKTLQEEQNRKRGELEDQNKLLNVFRGKANTVDMKLYGEKANMMYKNYPMSNGQPLTREEFADRALDIISRGNKQMFKHAQDIKSLMTERDYSDELRDKLEEIDKAPSSMTSQGYVQIGPSTSLENSRLNENRDWQKNKMWHQKVYPLLQDPMSNYLMDMKGSSKDDKQINYLPFKASEFSTPFENIKVPNENFDQLNRFYPPKIEDVEKQSIEENKEKMKNESKNEDESKKENNKEATAKKEMGSMNKTNPQVKAENQTSMITKQKTLEKTSKVVSNNDTTLDKSNDTVATKNTSSQFDDVMKKLDKHIDNNYHRDALQLLKHLAKSKTNKTTLKNITNKTVDLLHDLDENKTPKQNKNSSKTHPVVNESGILRHRVYFPRYKFLVKPAPIILMLTNTSQLMQGNDVSRHQSSESIVQPDRNKIDTTILLSPAKLTAHKEFIKKHLFNYLEYKRRHKV